jgi:hypothetical protein
MLLMASIAQRRQSPSGDRVAARAAKGPNRAHCSTSDLQRIFGAQFLSEMRELGTTYRVFPKPQWAHRARQWGSELMATFLGSDNVHRAELYANHVAPAGNGLTQPSR